MKSKENQKIFGTHRYESIKKRVSSRNRNPGPMNFSIDTYLKDSLVRSTIFDIKDDKIDELRESLATPRDFDSVID